MAHGKAAQRKRVARLLQRVLEESALQTLQRVVSPGTPRRLVRRSRKQSQDAARFKAVTLELVPRPMGLS